MGTYVIPRNLKGETRLLMVFSIKSLITTAIGAGIGAVVYFVVGVMMSQKIAGLIVLGILGLIGFAVGTFKIPTLAGIPFTKKIGGESIDEIVKRYAIFRTKKKKYSYYYLKDGEK
ncbi:MAG: hypothetical protein FWF46_02780 [Oscillospiraceae bacterium]|nr:hypothetical protein [Oscillospiraceae bacterium]